MPRSDPKLTPEQHRTLVEEYNIHFEGPIASSSWPEQYVEIFQPIRDMGRLLYEEYKPNERRGVRTVAEMKDRVARLNRIGYSCRKQRENEATWRGLAEPEIVSRFFSEVMCQICRQRLWDSELKASPDDPIEARNLERRRAKRTLCNCNLDARAMQDIDQKGGAQLFVSRFQTRFVHDPADRLREKGLGSQEPDRVFGLRETRAFTDNAFALAGLRRSPFGDGRVLYPFLIIEAKSEKGSRGFESIEMQTAFPIRTLLKLQNDLSTASGSGIKPLVWFLANQGDEWKVYGAILNDSRCRIIDLWRGSIRSRDDTLQLLLILDYICDWARDIYRLDILRCLASADSGMRDVTPAYSIVSSRTGTWNSILNSPSLPTRRSASPQAPSLIDLTLESDRDDTEMEDVSLIGLGDASDSSSNPAEEDDTSFNISDANGSNPLLRYLRSCEDPKHWSKRATIRHSDLVLFSFFHAAVPENSDMIRACLKLSDSADGAAHTTTLLHGLIQDANAVTITMNGVLQLENMWTRTTHQLSSENDEPILAWIFFDSYLRPGDWQVVRRLSCVTVSVSAFTELVAIAGIPWVPLAEDWAAHRCHCLTTDAESLRSLCGKESVISAASSLSLQLETYFHDDGNTHFRWKKGVDTIARRSNIGRQYLARLLESNAVRRGELLEELLPGKVVPQCLVPLVGVPAEFGEPGAVLLKKAPFPWPSSCPKFCLMVFDGTNFDQEPDLSHKVVEAASQGHIYAVQPTGACEKIVSPEESDKSAIQLWANILCGEAPADAEWPS